MGATHFKTKTLKQVRTEMSLQRVETADARCPLSTQSGRWEGLLIGPSTFAYPFRLKQSR
jgi:hypothetical protein